MSYGIFCDRSYRFKMCRNLTYFDMNKILSSFDRCAQLVMKWFKLLYRRVHSEIWPVRIHVPSLSYWNPSLLLSLLTSCEHKKVKPFCNYSKIILLLKMSRNFPNLERNQWLSYLFSWDICQRDGGSVGICVHSNPKRCRSTHNSNRKLRNCWSRGEDFSKCHGYPGFYVQPKANTL